MRIAARLRAVDIQSGDAATVCKLHVTFAGTFVAANGEDVFAGPVACDMELKRARVLRSATQCRWAVLIKVLLTVSAAWDRAEPRIGRPYQLE